MACPKGHEVLVTLAAVTCAAGIAACGSSSKPSGSASSTYPQNIKYADCMRSHGVPNFPDPVDGGFPLRTSGINESSPAFLSAQKACASLQPGGSAPPRITGHDVYEMALKARCIRRHGFSNFPDPMVAPGGPGGEEMFSNPPPDWNNEAPAAIKARIACANVGIPIPGWGVAWFGPT